MRDTVLREDGERTFLLVFDPGDRIMETLTGFARDQGITAGRVMGIGAIRQAELGFFHHDRRDYEHWNEGHRDGRSAASGTRTAAFR